MREIQRICLQMQHMFEGGAWHGPAVLEVLKDVDAATAAAHPVAGVRSIWETTLHLVATYDILLRRIDGIAAGTTDEEFWPPLPAPTAVEWQKTLDLLRQRDQELHRAVAAFADEKLDQPLVPGGSTAYENFHGHVQHNAYHAAQIHFIHRLVQSGS